MKFRQLLKENWGNARKLIKTRNPLFHATYNIDAILKDKGIKNMNQDGVSTSRNLDFLIRDGINEFGRFIFVIDRDKVSKRLKLQPIRYPYTEDGQDEFEEKIITKKLTIKPYIVGLIVNAYNPTQIELETYANWKKEFNLPFDVIIYYKGKYQYAKEML